MILLSELELQAPPAELVPVEMLRVDNENPNRLGLRARALHYMCAPDLRQCYRIF
jgi:hypothetical protein